LASLIGVVALLLFSACTQQGGKGTPVSVTVLNATEAVTHLELQVNDQTVPATREGGVWRAQVQLPPGEHELVARGLDAPRPQGIVLYKAHERLRVTPGQEVRLSLYRLTADVRVRVQNPPGPEEVVLARAGGSLARLVDGEGVLQGVPTGRDIPLLVESRSPGGLLLRQGQARFTLSEGGTEVSLSLQEAVHQAPRVELTLPQGARTGEEVEVGYLVEDSNPEASGVGLARLRLDFGDGRVREIPLSGRRAQGTVRHTYEAGGTFQVVASAWNTAGLMGQASAPLQVLYPDTPVVVAPGPEAYPVSLRVEGLPEGTSGVRAVLEPTTPLVPQALRPQNLKNRYELELVPMGGGFLGALSLPGQRDYRLHFLARGTYGERTSRTYTFRLDREPLELRYPFEAALACPPPAAPEAAPYAVQGAGERSPLEGQTVAVRGVVTATFPGLSGFYLQDPEGDGNPDTSDGLFVYLPSSAPAYREVRPGQYVQVVGRVVEYAAGGDTLGTLTQLANVSRVEVCGEAPLPEAITLTLPREDLERYEGMRVRLAGLIVTDGYNLGRYGELTLAPSRLVHPNADGRPDTRLDPALAPYRGHTLVLDDGATRQNPNPIPYLPAGGTLRVGDTLVLAEGVLEWRFGAYRVQPTAEPRFEATNPRPPRPEASGLRVASFNLHNWFTQFSGTFTPPGCANALAVRGAQSPEEWERQKAKLVAALEALDADVVALQEVQNNGQEAIAALVAALNERMGTGTYAFVPDPEGGLGCDAIKVGLIYKPARLEPVGGPRALQQADTFERFPLAQTFRDKASGGVFTVVSVHLKSKGSCDPADPDTGEGCWNRRRTAQAQALLRWLPDLTAQDADVLFLGDFNAYEEELPLRTLREGGLSPLLTGHYTFVYQGLSGALDHAYATPSLTGQVGRALVWHVNADEPRVLDYTLAYKTADPYRPDPYRSSDHDPLLLALNLTPDANPGTGSGPSCATDGPPVVVNEFRFRGPNGGNDEFVELFNRSCQAVSLQGWKVQGYTGTNTWADRATLGAVTLQPGQYYLLANTATSGYSLSVAPDLTYSTGIADNRAVRLLDATGRVVDLVGFQSSGQCQGSCLQDGPTGGVTTQISWKRLPSGRHTGNNAADFQFGSDWANPQNTRSPLYGDN